MVLRAQCAAMVIVPRRSLTLHAQGNAHAAADAKRRQALLRLALLHLMQQGHEHARARGADGMAERDRAAIHVDLRWIEIEVLGDGTSLSGESLVRLDQIEILDLPTGALQREA